ncbi:MAG: IPT/TIG domain-containing protein, partial [Myxococcaceae bacterium]
MLVFASACATKAPSDPGLKGDGGFDCGSTTPASLDQLYGALFSQASATSCTNGCHAVSAGGLTFGSAAELYAATVNVPSQGLPGTVLVTPHSPAESTLFARLSGELLPTMPVGGIPLTAAQLSEVGGWICAGAPPPAGSDGGTGRPAPALSGFAPSQGLAGTLVTLTGTGFSAFAADNDVRFNGTVAPLESASPTQIQAYVPAGASSGPITVTVGTQSATSSSAFAVVAGNPVPVITALSPCGLVAGAAGATVTVTGLNFIPSTTARFQGKAVSVTFDSSTQLRVTLAAPDLATAPSGNAAVLTLQNPTPGGGSSPSADFGIASAVSTLDAQVQPLLSASCGGNGCHSGGQFPNLGAGQTRAQIVDVPAQGCPSKLLVRRCSPTRAKSFLIDKILATMQSQPCSGS